MQTEESRLLPETQVEDGIRKLKNRTALEKNNINNELNKIYRDKKHIPNINGIIVVLPKCWKMSITTCIFNKVENKNPGNYRGITLLSSVMKIRNQ